MIRSLFVCMITTWKYSQDSNYVFKGSNSLSIKTVASKNKKEKGKWARENGFMVCSTVAEYF